MRTEYVQQIDPRRRHTVTELTGMIAQRYPTASFDIGPGEEDATDGEQHVLLPSLVNALQFISAILAGGDDVALIPLDKELSVDEAAALLNVSRPFLDKLLDDGAIPSLQGDVQRRIHLRDVMEYRQRRSERNKRLLDEALSFAQEHGGYD